MYPCVRRGKPRRYNGPYWQAMWDGYEPGGIEVTKTAYVGKDLPRELEPFVRAKDRKWIPKR